MLLLGLLSENREQLMADFPRYYGIPLSVVHEHVTLREFAAMAKHLPRGSATWRALNGSERDEWDLTAQLLAEAVNELRILSWQNTKDGHMGRRKPDRVLPPWVEDETKEVKVFGADAVPLDELDMFLGWSPAA